MNSKFKSNSRCKFRKLRKHCNNKYIYPVPVNVPTALRPCHCFSMAECWKKTPVASGGLSFSLKLRAVERPNASKGLNLHSHR